MVQKKGFARIFVVFWVVWAGWTGLAFALTQTQITAGLQAAVGVAIDESKNQIYFVEYNPAGNGKLKRIDLPPQCGTSSTPACSATIAVIADAFSHPEDVRLDPDHGVAYVTTRDDPGTTGALWRVDLTTGAKTMVTFNLGAPHQIVLDIPNNHAYTVSFDDGRLRRIDLTTGAKTPVFIGLDHPVGLAITADGQFAYVSEQGPPARVSQIDLTTGTKVGEVIRDGVDGVSLTAPFYMAWANVTQTSLYVVEREPANRLSRVDLAAGTKHDVVTGLPWRPSGTTVTSLGSPVYVASDAEITKVDLVELLGPVFMGVGHVPAGKIDSNGYATTDPGYFFQVKHAPFGGTLNIFGNLTNFRALGATHYVVLVSKDGGPFEPLNLSWNTYKWNTATFEYDLTPVAPADTVPVVPAEPAYAIPLESDGDFHPEFWYPPFLFMRWPSGENGLYTFQVKIYEKSGATWIDRTPSLPSLLNSLAVRVDNTPPEVEILSIWQRGTPDKEVMTCDIVSAGPNQYYFRIKAYDPNHHLRRYRFKALWGDNQAAVIDYHNYTGDAAHPAPVGHIDAEGPYQWSGVINARVPASPTAYWSAACNCAHTFHLWAEKRTINGYDRILWRPYHKSITINNTGSTCP